MCKKLFVVADVHGFYTELMSALNNVGFNPNDDNHMFVSCGDLFDRGCENKLVYEFVTGLKNKILIRGNHEDILRGVLSRGSITRNEISNGTDITVFELLGKDAVNEEGIFDTKIHWLKIKELTDFIDSMLDYYEMGDYIFTHGWLPIVFEGRYPSVDENWRQALSFVWEESRWLEWQQLYSVDAVLNGKTIVCGHRPAYLGYLFDQSRESDCSEPFYGEGLIAIDAGTKRSGRVNVLVIEESLL